MVPMRLGWWARCPAGRGVIEDRQIAEISATICPPVAGFLLSSETDAVALARHARRYRVNVLQLVDRVALEVYAELREALPGVKLVQVVHVAGPETVAGARDLAPLVDALLLDSGQPDAAIKLLGGTGRTHDWEISRRIVDAVEAPVFLAGGLRPDNVARAIGDVQPFGVDLCTGVRTDRRLDPVKLGAFVDAVRGLESRRSDSQQDNLGRDTVAHR